MKDLFSAGALLVTPHVPISNILARHPRGLFDLWTKQTLTCWNRGVDFDDEELGYQEEDKPPIKVGKNIQLRFTSTMFP